MEHCFFKEKTEGKIEVHQHKVRWTKKITCEVGYTKPSCDVIEGSIRGGPSTEERSTSVSGTKQGNSGLGFDVCVGVYQVERGQEHPKVAFKYFPIQLFKSMSPNVYLTLKNFFLIFSYKHFGGRKN